MLWRSDNQRQDILAATVEVDPVVHPHQWPTGSRIEALATVEDQTILDLEAVDTEHTARQDRTHIQPAVEPSVFSEDLAAILHRSFGPIAAALLTRVEFARVTDPALAIEILLPLLPERERDNFARQSRGFGRMPTPALDSSGTVPGSPPDDECHSCC